MLVTWSTEVYDIGGHFASNAVDAARRPRDDDRRGLVMCSRVEAVLTSSLLIFGRAVNSLKTPYCQCLATVSAEDYH